MHFALPPVHEMHPSQVPHTQQRFVVRSLTSRRWQHRDCEHDSRMVAAFQRCKLAVQYSTDFGGGRIVGDMADDIDVSFDELGGKHVVAVLADAGANGFRDVE